MRRTRAPYTVMTFVCLVVSLIGMYRGDDVTYLWITTWGLIIMNEVAR